MQETTDETFNMNRPRILSFKNKPPAPVESFPRGYLSPHRQEAKPSKPLRTIPQSAERTLDAPDLVDDFYLNLLDWSCQNSLAVALGNTVYLWDPSTGSNVELVTIDDEDGPVTSVGWAPDGKHIAIGLNNSYAQLWDSIAAKLIRTLREGHHERVGSLAWNNTILSTGGRDSKIINNDVRSITSLNLSLVTWTVHASSSAHLHSSFLLKPIQELSTFNRSHIVETYRGHHQEVCGLKWSSSGQHLASGGNDNLLFIWDRSTASSRSPHQWLHRLHDHTAAVKALAWCPFQGNLLASGGGEGDDCIKFWNAHTGLCLNSVDTDSQVCGLLWSKNERELLSSHGFSKNHLVLWKYPTMVRMAELNGHTSRVLFMTRSPDGCTVATAAVGVDETLRLWKAFGVPEVAKPPEKESPLPFGCSHFIR